MKRIIVVILLIFVSVSSYCRQANILHSTSDTEHKNIKVAMLLPLFYESIDELSFNEYNIDEKRGKNYKCFSYISFYEGARIALDNLEKKGYKVSLYVFDVGENDARKMQQALDYPAMKEMDLIIPLVFKQSFETVSAFCQTNGIPLVNPMSQDNSILKNPYVFKIQPDGEAMSNCIMKYIEQKCKASKIIVIYDDKNVPPQLINYWKENLPQITDNWTILNYRKNAAKLKNYISKTENNVVVNLTDKPSERDNKMYAQNLMNTLLQTKSDITLCAQYDWLDYAGNDYKKLQDLDFHFPLSYYNDYTNSDFVEFASVYRRNFKTEPQKIYAALGYDIIMFFIPLIKDKGDQFIQQPVANNQKDMISRYRFIRNDSSSGWQNGNATIYKLDNYKIKSQWNY
ncbi:MAG: ABC transporter substrate-binding protein [Bacteroidales bacterium]|nr:ABC transporter substrate-binding protein [Bacteroidales bacterium]